MKKIISTALTVIMLLTSIIAIIPVNAFAALSAAPDTEIEESNLTLEQVQAYVDTFYLGSSYATAEEMLKSIRGEGTDENSKKYGNPQNLISATSSDNKYMIHIDRYTGFVFYENLVTGQILTSNPIDPGTGASGEAERQKLMSQIEISFAEASNAKKTYDYNSVQWAARYSQISVSKITGGLRVNYTLGDTTTRFLLPGRITSKDFHDYIIVPIIKNFQTLFREAMESVEMGDLAYDLIHEDKAAYDEDGVVNPYYLYENVSSLKGTYSEYVLDKTKVEAYIEAAKAIYNDKQYGVAKEYLDQLSANYTVIVKMLSQYALKDPYSNNFYSATGEIIAQDMIDSMIKDFPLSATTPIYVFDKNAFANNLISKLREYSNYIKTYCPDYTFEMMYEDEKECSFEYTAAQKPVFRCALEYTFNTDGSLSVRLPANSITFDETAYNLKSITPIKYFGAGDMSKDGYLFYPDGSGSVLEFGDFYTDEKKVAINLESKVYGKDYCYSSITGKHREQITMPVFGMVSTANANATTKARFGVSEVKNGYFVIIEEGNSLATLGFTSGGSSHKYVSSYASYNPYPTDEYELAETISVGSTSEINVMVGETKYAGSYVSRIVMLTDSAIGESFYKSGNYYDASYTGMAAYYRDILKANGTLTALENVEENIPLYIEALGAMTITDKFLTFPVEKAIPLTTFENIATIYKELAEAESHVKALYENYIDLASKEENDLLRIEYEQKAEKYKALIGNIQNVKNVNFKLTGFANGGMNFTYPTKLKWEKCCGGSSGFEDLVALSGTESAKEGYNFGIFPDFDFLYINNTASFDGISNKGNVSRMIDNRYASKQVYNSVLGEFESFFTMVISSDTLLEHFSSFNEKYSEFALKKLSVSTVGSDLNSNFDAKNTVDRNASMKNSIALLEEIAYQNDYEVMMDVGNIYAAKYADHILNATTDFSGFRFSSYAIPFVGMILHGYVSYAGSPLNYSGSPDYDILRAIETGANPYYIVAYQNNAYMKDDEVLSKYYGIDYANWYDEILVNYNKMNKVLKGLQTHEIVAHTTVRVERTADKNERLANYNLLKDELLLLFKAQLSDVVDNAVTVYGSDVKVVVDVEALYNQFAGEILGKYKAEIEADVVDGKSALKEAIREVAVAYANEYTGTEEIKFSALKNENGDSYTSYREYSEYKFTTDSTVYEDSTYDETVYTLDNGNVVMVTYKKGTEEVKFVLNYNLFDVDVRIDADTVVTVGSYGYYPITK